MEQIQTKTPTSMMDEVKVSVIIPVYNSCSCIAKCLESVLVQTLSEIEILCVDDGSTDQSLSILRDYESEHLNIRIFATANFGVSHARNLALDYARGEFIAFLDSDDYYYIPTALEELYRTAKKHGVSICGGLRVCDMNGYISAHPLHRKLITAHPEGALVRYQDYQQDYHFHNYIYQRKMLNSENLRFPEYKRYEDPVFFAAAMTIAELFYIIPAEVYCYRRKGKMLSTTPQATMDTIQGIMDNLKLSSEHQLAQLHFSCVQRLNKEYCVNILEAAESPARDAVIDLLEEANASQDYSLIHKVNPTYQAGTLLRPLRIIRNNKPLALQTEKILTIRRKIKDVGFGYTLKVVLQKITRRKK